jgi:hypothetical protein
MSAKLQSIQKQNDSILFSLLSRKIDFVRDIIPEGIGEDEHIRILNEENLRLKEVVKANKPTHQPKEEKPKIEQPESKPKEKSESKEDDDQEETFEEPVKKFETITNMEDLKRAFFNGLYEEFETHVKASPYKFYRVEYKYNGDKDGAPDFSAKNLLKGFVRNFDDYRKYFMICFRCWKDSNEIKIKYQYKSLWIVNTLEPIQSIIGSFSDDFEFVEESDLTTFILDIKKLENIDESLCIGESYVH